MAWILMTASKQVKNDVGNTHLPAWLSLAREKRWCMVQHQSDGDCDKREKAGQ
jgi:hypothetical protein